MFENLKIRKQFDLIYSPWSYHNIKVFVELEKKIPFKK